MIFAVDYKVDREERMIRCSKAMWTRGGAVRSCRKGARKCLLCQRKRRPEVVASGREHGLPAVVVVLFEIISGHAVLGFDVADDGLNGGTPFHLAADRGSDATGRAGNQHAELLLAIVAAIALVDMDKTIMGNRP
jgi:hypothetical protein